MADYISECLVQDQSVKHFLSPKNQEIRSVFLKNQEVIRNFLALKVTISYEIISNGRLLPLYM